MKAIPGFLSFILIGSTCLGQAEPPVPEIRVAVFVDAGTGDSREKVVSALETDGAIRVERLTAADIQSGKLSNFEVLIHPGGSASKQGKALGAEGRRVVRDFVSRGGGYVGFCAGSYLATNDYDWSLHLIDAKVVDRKHWARGKGPVEVKLSSAGATLLKSGGDTVSIYYAQGPLLGRPEWDDPDTPDYESLGLFQTEIAKNGAPAGVMARTTAIARAEFGHGRVFCFSPHPELTEGLAGFVPRAVRWAAGGGSGGDAH
ncbi:MAG: biofilm PGA synthesis protein PgaB [Verrucomicrobiae bacterium]|nr:biofilm PGA synthesis protein PgaB [Verrucomicrobiae bacterium]